MDSFEYKRQRRLRGKQFEVAVLLGVRPETISRREKGESPINKEAELALLSIPIRMDLPEVVE
jgi:hypothetical protein